MMEKTADRAYLTEAVDQALSVFRTGEERKTRRSPGTSGNPPAAS